jgi:predicted TIM-barrel fold metal-dependent hydrolase
MVAHHREIDPLPLEARRPTLKVPKGATDCHFHIFGPVDTYPLSPLRMYDPADASVERYLRMAAAVGIERVVVVNGSPYGVDNRCTLDAIAEFGRERARGIAVVDPEASEKDLEDLYARGIRGLRINLITGRTPIEALPVLAKRVSGRGMHIQLWLKGERLSEIVKVLSEIDVPVVLDHMGQVPTSLGMEHPQFQTLLRMLGTGKVWIKLIGYRISGGPPYADLAGPVSKILSIAADRCVWGSDWPHPFLEGRQMPNDGDLMDLLASWCADALLKRILVDNPARLYGF